MVAKLVFQQLVSILALVHGKKNLFIVLTSHSHIIKYIYIFLALSNPLLLRAVMACGTMFKFNQLRALEDVKKKKKIQQRQVSFSQ